MVRTVEISSVAILAIYMFIEWRQGRLARFASDAALIGVSGWLSEDVCIRLFHFYAYAPGWTLQLDQVPLAVAVIWPFVVLSARAVAEGIRPGSGARWAWAIVLFDAALIEPIAVRSGLWSWAEPGLWGVPLIGIAGWGVFAAVMLAVIERPRLRLMAPLLGAAGSNAALVVLWWGAFRWLLRSDLPPLAALAVGVGASLAIVAGLRSRRSAVEWEVMLPRACAAALFFALVARSGDALLCAYAAAFAPPYLWVTRWGSLRRRPSSRPSTA